MEPVALREQVGRFRLDAELGGNVRFDLQPTNSRHQHTYWEACLVTEGTGWYDHGRERHPLSPGDVFIAEPDVAHEIASFETRDLSLYFASFVLVDAGGPSQTPEDAVFAAFLARHHVVRRADRDLRGYVAAMRGAGGGFRRHAARQALKLFTLEMLDVLSETTLPPPTDDQNELERALAYIERNLHRRMTAEEVADHVGISARTLRRRLQAATHRGFADAVNGRRMVHAAHRLLMGFSAAEAAREVGILDAAQFTRAFRRALGVTPREYQSNYVPAAKTTDFRPPAATMEPCARSSSTSTD